MAIIRLVLSVLLICLVSFATEVDARPLYVCDDGTTVLLTDDAARGCPAYEPRAELITVPEGATWADVEWAVALKMAEQPSPAVQRRQKVLADACALWLDLALDTDGGLDMQTSENTRKWLALSRIVTATNICDEYLTKEIYPKF